MNYLNLVIYTVLLSFCPFFSAQHIEAAITDQATGQSFPDSQTVQFDQKDHTLTATGVATRKKIFFKIYSIAHFMEDPQKADGSAIFNKILDSKKPKRFYLKWVRNVSQKQVQDGYQESFNTVVNRDQRSKIEGDISKYIGFFNSGVKKGDSHILTWLPDGTIVVSINDKPVGSIKSQDFARALWSIWFGPRSVVNRNDLISNIR